MVEVAQEDREVAAALAEWLIKAQINWGGKEIWFIPSFPAEVRKGTWDNHDWVEAFARHRIAAQEAAIKAALEAAAKEAEELTAEVDRGHDYGECASKRIRALTVDQIMKGMGG